MTAADGAVPPSRPRGRARLDAPGEVVFPGTVGADGVHVIDRMIRDRAKQLLDHPLWPLAKPVLYPFLGYNRAVAMAEDLHYMSGADCFAYVQDRLAMNVRVEGLEHVPASGPFILAPNHPTGLPDGIAVFAALREKRPDHVYFANRDAFQVAPRLAEMIIPVEYVRPDVKREYAGSRDTLSATLRAVRTGKGLVLFPSGRIAFRRNGRLNEQPWLPSLVAFHRRFGAPIVPLHIEQRNSRFYYFAWDVSPELRDMTLFHELLHKQHKTVRLRFGEPLAPEDVPHEDERTATRAVQAYVERDLPAGRRWADRTPPPAGPPAARR